MVPAKVWTLVSILTWPVCLGAIGDRVARSAEIWGHHLGELWPAGAAPEVKRDGLAIERRLLQPSKPARPSSEIAGIPSRETPSRQPGPALGQANQSAKPAAPRPARPQTPSGVRLSQQRVLRLAQARVVPEATPTGSAPSRPAGLLLRGVSQLGVGVRDGDVLSHVSGVAVTSVSQVVSLVLQARARQAPAIGATLWRGTQSYPLVVEMPYLVPIPAASDPPSVDSSAHGDLRTSPMGLGNEHGPNRQMHQTPPRAGGSG